jgi:hypothetical protein
VVAGGATTDEENEEYEGAPVPPTRDKGGDDDANGNVAGSDVDGVENNAEKDEENIAANDSDMGADGAIRAELDEFTRVNTARTKGERRKRAADKTKPNTKQVNETRNKCVPISV